MIYARKMGKICIYKKVFVYLQSISNRRVEDAKS